MYSSQPHAIKFRENRSWGFEVRFGPDELESVVEHKTFSKPLPCVAPIGQIANVFIPCELRSRAGQARRLIVSVWVSSPVSAELSSDLRGKLVRMHKAIKRLANMKISNFFKERLYASGKKAESAQAGETCIATPAKEGQTGQVVDW